MISRKWLGLVLSQILSSQLFAQEQESTVIGPVEKTYATVGTVDLKAYVFSPNERRYKSRSAIVIFHGGGWSIGEASWAFGRAEHFASIGMVAVAAQYRLSNQIDVTPVDAMQDARNVIRWVRMHADSLDIIPNQIAAYGWSAGAHLSASAALFPDPESHLKESRPDALVLVSPAVYLKTDSWVQKLLGPEVQVISISPYEHIKEGMPPTLILEGRDDTVTPLHGVQLFCDAMNEAGNQCELVIYNEVGHLFTPSNEPDDGWPNPDPYVQAAAFKKADEFLKKLGFLK